MKKTMTRSGYVAALLLCLFMAAPVAARELQPIVSTEWLAANLDKPGMVLLDIRKVEYYLSGHIPGAVNAFYSAWTVKKVDLYTEIPEMDDLFDLIGEAGIDGNSRVVIIGKADTPQERVCMARVACALEYGGVKNVAILDGGHNQWVRENRVISHESDKPTSKIYSGQIDRKVFVKKEYVLDHLGKVLMVDVREPDFFVGRKKTSLVERAGHIPGAVNLPTSRAFASDGKFKPVKELARIAAEVVGEDLSREIVTYCDTGKCCPTWRFLLKELLGYRNTYLYDGSIQEWTRDPTSPME